MNRRWIVATAVLGLTAIVVASIGVLAQDDATARAGGALFTAAFILHLRNAARA